MADWASDVKKYAPNADDKVIAGIVRHCGIALQKTDSSLVSYSDQAELDRVRNGFLKKKLALTDDDGQVVHDHAFDATHFHMATGVREHHGRVWLGSLVEPAVAWFDI